MRLENFAKNEHYHVSNSGVGEQKIFIDDQDKARFIFLITHFQSPTRMYNVSWYTNSFIKKNSFVENEARVKSILKHRSIRLTAFALMPESFHLLVQNLEEGVLSVYMQRILTAYSKYFNAKYNKVGHVFHGPFQATRIKSNDQLLYLSNYIGKDPKIFVNKSFNTVGFAEPFVSFMP